MNTVIWKYPLDWIGEQYINMPAGAEILTAQTQGADLCLWALVNPEEPWLGRHLRLIGTGQPVTNASGLRYISTVQIAHAGDPAFVFHLFEVLVA